ncbi:MAG: hypothetical protein PHT91_01025 [Candidatus Nanoarchaeia archaeon]|nr:hypothetical protein [Candidatus Nanoarchaeia archaeon]MDD5499442.1 hypothetical protein [Candidatus Nanoarchaeia archaeon]
MKKAVTDYPLGLLIGIIIISLIVYYGAMQISSFLRMRSYQEFSLNVLRIIDSMDYLKESNAKYSFLNIKFDVPDGQSIYFDSESNSIVLEGHFSQSIGLSHELISESFECDKNCSIIICYYSCSTEHGRVVVFE